MTYIKQTQFFFVFAFCVILISACNSKDIPSKSIAFYFLKDVTASAGNENQSLDLSSAKLTRLFGLDSDPLVQAEYFQSLITEVHLNKEYSAILPPADLDNFNKFKRKNAIKKFLSNIDTANQDLQNAKFGRPQSSIFLPVAKTINKLAETKANKQILVVQSDLFENTFILSKYDKAQMNKIENKPQSLEQVLDKETPIFSRLDNMTIYIINQPKTDTDKDFYIISNIYKNWLESKGAKVSIMANLNV